MQHHPTFRRVRLDVRVRVAIQKVTDLAGSWHLGSHGEAGREMKGLVKGTRLRAFATLKIQMNNAFASFYSNV
jgi:hypothetical protein